MSNASSDIPAATPPSLFWRIWSVIALITVVVAAYLIAPTIGGAALYVINFLLGRPFWLTDTTNQQFLFTLLTYAVMLAIVVAYGRQQGIDRRKTGLTRPDWVDPFWALTALPVYYILFGVTLKLVTLAVPGFDPNQEQQLGFSSAAGSQLILVFLSLVIIPPVVEEIIARGYLYGGLRTMLPRYGAVLITSALFAIGHLEFGNGGPLVWVAAVFTFILSLVLIFLRDFTGRLYAPIVLHAVVNGVSFMYLFVLSR